MRVLNLRLEVSRPVDYAIFSTLTMALCGCLHQPAMSGDTLMCCCGPVRVVTKGTGNDTEAVWAPNGKSIAFQTDRDGDLDVAVVDVASGAITGVVTGGGHACYPAWTKDGDLVYAYIGRTGSAAQGSKPENIEGGCGLRLLQSGAKRVLTQGLWRDYTPSVATDGATGYYATTQGLAENSASLARISLEPGATPECLLRLDGPSSGAVQPSLSPDGRILLWSQLDGLATDRAWWLRILQATTVWKPQMCPRWCGSAGLAITFHRGLSGAPPMGRAGRTSG